MPGPREVSVAVAGAGCRPGEHRGVVPIVLIPFAIPRLLVLAIGAIAFVWSRWPYVGAAVAIAAVGVVLYLGAQGPDCFYNCPID